MSTLLHVIDPALDWAARIIQTVLSALFQAETDSRKNWIARAWLGILFLGGALAWGYFFSLGNFPLTFHDWAAVSGPRFTFLKDAVTHAQPVLHAASNFDPSQTSRYLSIPDAFLSPQALLLRFLTVQQFILVDVWILYALGFAGLLALKHKLRLSPIALTVVFLLFNFNGHIVAHFSIGHATWGGYFLFTWFAYLILSLIDGQPSWRWVAGMVLLLLVMYVQGSFHQFVWCLFFLGFLACTGRKLFLPALSAAFFAVLASLFRILPPALMLDQFDSAYKGGYPGLYGILDALVNIQAPTQSVPFSEAYLGVWETTLYVGVLGALFLAYFGVYRWASGRMKRTPYPQLLLPIIAMSILSLGIAYGWLRSLPLPFLSSERVVSRLISLPFTFLVLIAASEFQRWTETFPLKNTVGRIGMLAIIVAEACDLARNIKIWKVATVAQAFPVEIFDPERWYAVQIPDPDYTGRIVFGAALSLLSLFWLLFLAWRDGEKKRLPSFLQKIRSSS